MRPALALATAAGLYAVGPAQAQSWLVDGRPAPPSPDLGRSGDLAVHQIASTDPEGVETAWAKPTPGVDLPTAVKTVRNKPIVTFLIFTGCHATADGNCNVTADFKITDAKGDGNGDQANVPVWSKPPPGPGILYLSEAAIGLLVHKGEPLGDYVVRVTTTDHVAGTTVRTQQTIHVREAR
jgi:hypothetical protein